MAFAHLSCSAGPQEPTQPKQLTKPVVTDADPSFARVPEGTIGPFLALSNDNALTLWAEPELADSGFAWYSRSLTANGRPLYPARRIAKNDGGPELVRLEPLGDGYLAVFSRLPGSAKNPTDTLQSLRMAADGKLSAPPRSLRKGLGQVLWLDILPTNAGALVVWAERAGTSAALFALAVDDSGAAISNDTPLPGRARAWQGAAGPDGAVILMVDENRRLSLVQVSEQAEVLNTREVPEAAQVSSEVDLVRAGDRLFYAYSAAPLLDRHVFVGVAALDGTPLAPPKVAVPPKGEQSLVRLVQRGESAVLVWRDVAQSPDLLNLANLNPEGVVSQPASQLEWPATTPAPEFTGSSRGLHALAWSCVESVGCQKPRVPTRVDFDDDLVPSSVTPWLIDGASPDLSWDLSCSDTGCLGLSAVFGETTRVYAMKQGAEGHWALPAWQASIGKPRALESESLLEPLALSSFEVMSSSEGTLLAWLSYFDPSTPYVTPDRPAPDGRLAPVRAELRTQWLAKGFDGSSGGELPENFVISYRARSPGGVSLSRGRKNHLLVWTAIDDKTPQVFTTLLDDRGKKVAQQMLTRQKGDVVAVRSVPVGGVPSNDGWIVGWVDDRTGESRPYLTRISERLARRVPDKTVGPPGLQTSEFAVTVAGGEVWHARIDNGADGSAIVVLTRLRSDSLVVIAEDVLGSADGTYRFPTFVEAASSPTLAFVDEQNGAVAFRVFDEKGSVQRSWAWQPSNHPVALAARCDGASCGVLATTQSDQAQFVEAASFAETGVSATQLIGGLLSNRALAVSPALSGNDAWLYDLSERGKPRLQRWRMAF